MNIKKMPQCIEIEKELLGNIIINNRNIEKTVSEIEVDDFYLIQHQEIYKACLGLYAEGVQISVVTIVEKVTKEDIKKVGSISYLVELQDCTMYSELENIIKILKDKSFRRKAITRATEAIEKLYDEKTDCRDVVGSLQQFGIEKTKTKIVNDKELFLSTLEDIENQYQNGGEIPGMKTGFRGFDSVTNGFKKGELIVIAGRPSMGKTLIALNLLDGLGKNGYKSGLIELEMTEKQLGKRRLAYNSLIEAQKLQTGKLTEDEFVRIAKEANILSKRNMILTDCSDYQDILTIKAKAKAMKTTHNIEVLAIDHLGLMNIVDNGNRAYAVGDVTRQLKLLAKELDITVIVLSQLSRAVEQRADKRPMLSDLRESGAIEQDADLVMFAYRDEYYNKETEDTGIMEWIIAKQRDGKTGVLKLAYIDKYQKIADLEVKK